MTGYLEKKYSIDLTVTAENPKALSEALEAAINGGSRVAQRRLLRLLYEKMNLKPPSNVLMTVNFEALITEAAKAYEGGATKS